MKKLQTVIVLVIMSFVYVTPARAWNGTGHSVVAEIAWRNLDDSTKREIVDALKTAPADSRMVRSLPANVNSWPADVNDPRYEELFQFIGTWPDMVRPGNRRRATDKYHHGNWHFRNIFWNGSDGSDAAKPQFGDMIDKLNEFSGSGSSENLAVQVAWLVHLVGDIHQPLHCSARITTEPAEIDGDKGGNEFCLVAGCLTDHNKLNLHAFWDSSLTRNFDPEPGETNFNYFIRVGKDITDRHPKENFTGLINNMNFSDWSRESVDKAKEAYPDNLKRDQIPSFNYRKATLRVVEPQTALAGYRLAKLLENKFSN